MNHKPRIAVITDENTSVDGSRYDTSKSYFAAIGRAGGLPFGIPYLPDLVRPVVEEFDGFLSIGGRINFLEAWYVEGDHSRNKPSDRLAVEQALMEEFLARNKPVLGTCNGMQMLGCLHGCRMVSDVHSSRPGAIKHDQPDFLHDVKIQGGTSLASILGLETFDVNTFHREALVELSQHVVATAHGPDGVIEAIEIPSLSFAIGLQWHPEKFDPGDHPGARVFKAFVQAASGVLLQTQSKDEEGQALCRAPMRRVRASARRGIAANYGRTSPVLSASCGSSRYLPGPLEQTPST